MLLKGFEFKEQSEKKRGRNAGTEAKIQDLTKLRDEHKRKNQLTIGRVTACNLIGIDPKTVKKYALELWERWEDWDF